MAGELAEALRQSASRLGVDPVDLGTVISYETAGSFDPWKAGPTTKWGQHRGLIQWGEPQRKKYGVYEGMPVGQQLQAAERYLADAGFKPGMGILDLYSAINAGRVGRYDASDAAAGGAPGTVRDKVEKQMGPHRAKAEALLGGKSVGSLFAQNSPERPQAGTTLAEALPGAVLPDFGTAPAPAVVPGTSAVAAAVLQNQERRRQSQEQAEAEQLRKVALFNSVAGMFG